jgi:uncharacterized protein (DUF3820 family)
MSIQENVDARKRAKEWIDLIGVEVPHFWQAMVELCSEHIPKQETPILSDKMSEIEAIKFEDKRMEWGQYRGERIWAVPADYLYWLVEDGSKRVADIKRYLNSDRFKRLKGMGEIDG